jgi:5-methylcytosine-specific restriction endonuclease McrA
MSLQRKNKWLQPKKAVVHKFEEQTERVREQTKAYWDELALPRHKQFNRKPKPSKPKGSHRTVKEKLKAIAYTQAEERDEGECLVCKEQGKSVEARSHHHIIKQGTRYRPEYIQRMENVVLTCTDCHTEIHNPKGKSKKQIYLEQWQQRYYPEYSAMMKELAKVTGCRDQWLIDRWNEKQAISV